MAGFTACELTCQRGAFMRKKARYNATAGSPAGVVFKIPLNRVKANVAQWQSNGFVNRRSVVQSHSLAPVFPAVSLF